MVSSQAPRFAATLYGLALVALLAAPLDVHDRRTHGLLAVHPDSSPRKLLRDVGQNVAVFAPFGLLLRRAYRMAGTGCHAPFVAPITIAVSIALAIDSVRALMPGRYPSLIDVAMNAVGAVNGAGA
jgi:VanZ family protein